MELTLVEKHQIKYNSKEHKECDKLCFLSKNLYNSTLNQNLVSLVYFLELYVEFSEHIAFRITYRPILHIFNILEFNECLIWVLFHEK